MPRPVQTDTYYIAGALDVMSATLGGALNAEQVNRSRAVEDREYEFNRDKFDESIRQYDTSFSESVRQFDVDIDTQVSQAGLNRELTRETREDVQVYQAEEAVKVRDFDAEQNDLQRRLEYYRIKEGVKMDNRNRELQYQMNKESQYRNYLGEYKSYAEMPDYYISGASGKDYNPADIDFRTELTSLASGRGSDVFKIAPETAK